VGFYEDSPGLVFWATTHLWNSSSGSNGSSGSSSGSSSSSSGSVVSGGSGESSSAVNGHVLGSGAANFGLSAGALARSFPLLAGLGSGEVAQVLCGRPRLQAALKAGAMYPQAGGNPVNPEMTHATIFAHRCASAQTHRIDRRVHRHRQTQPEATPHNTTSTIKTCNS
jgi:hypothetical protein